MNSFKKISLAMLLVCSAGAGTVCAQSSVQSSSFQGWSTDSWYFAPSAAMLSPDSGFGVDGRGHGLGVAFGKPVSTEWDIQIGSKYGHQRDAAANYQQNTLGVDALFMFTRDKFRPFLLFGVGYQHDRLSANGRATTDYAPYIEAGLGFQLELDRRWALQLDFRREHGFLQNDGFAFSRNRNSYLSLGLNYTFD